MLEAATFHDRSLCVRCCQDVLFKTVPRNVSDHRIELGSGLAVVNTQPELSHTGLDLVVIVDVSKLIQLWKVRVLSFKRLVLLVFDFILDGSTDFLFMFCFESCRFEFVLLVVSFYLQVVNLGKLVVNEVLTFIE